MCVAGVVGARLNWSLAYTGCSLMAVSWRASLWPCGRIGAEAVVKWWGCVATTKSLRR